MKRFKKNNQEKFLNEFEEEYENNSIKNSELRERILNDPEWQKIFNEIKTSSYFAGLDR